MAMFNCFCVLGGGRKKKYKVYEETPDLVHYDKGHGTVEVKLEHPVKNPHAKELNSTSFSVSVPFGIQENSTCKVKVVSEESPLGAEATEASYEGEDERDDILSMKRDFSDFNLQAQVANGEDTDQSMNKEMNSYHSMDNETSNQSERKSYKDAIVGTEVIESGHVSDPGIVKAEFWAPPELKRSCSNLETSDVLRRMADQLPTLRTHSFDNLKYLSKGTGVEIIPEIHGSPVSVRTSCSADRVILKKHSSSQILPDVKPKLLPVGHDSNQKGGYYSDTLELNCASKELSKLNSPESFTEQPRNSGSVDKNYSNNQIWGTRSWPQNQWVAFCTESSSLTRVDEWVNSLDAQSSLPVTDEDTGDESIVFPPSPEHSVSPARSTTYMSRHPNANVSEEVFYANSVIQSLNSSSTVAHIAGMGLKVIPTISGFSSLRSVNLSGNFIVHIAPGSLPKGLHTLNLSRNKIAAIEGLRELTRLRVLDLSYNRISRIGHGLSNCTLIKELYLAGNKISDVEGLHRLLKLTVLDLSFNKITTAKALGQLVANYNSLLALNLLGNPIQSNIGDDQLRKTVSGLLPQLTYLNKQPIKPQRAREVAIDSVAKAALGNNGWSRRKPLKRVSPGGSSSSNGHLSSIGGGSQKSRQRSRSRVQHHSPIRRRS
uniref:Protein phosphatase 1 regulatory subunit pprA n=1 Tax=Nelumbo nucifera TaxID=4432 RepID=A0A822XNI4_NELNU|nr:TPA_asm: hypothetical protein HUJ06_023433 [Nelumbo nucifera]